jgi:hypothetical protein
LNAQIRITIAYSLKSTKVISRSIIETVKGRKMREKIFAISLLVLLTILSFTVIGSTRAVGEGQWIKSYTISEAETGKTLIEVNFQTGKNVEYSPILSGVNIIVTFTVDVFTTGSGNLRLTTGLQHSTVETDRYWGLVSSDYNLGSAFNPNSASADFNWVKGTFTMRCYGKTGDYTAPTVVTVVQLSSETGDVLDNIRPTVLTAAVDEFQNLYDQKYDKLQGLISAGVAPGYIQLFQNVLSQSVQLVNQGDVDGAIALLNALPNSGEPQGSAFEAIALPAIVAIAVVAAIFAFMFLRTRGRNGYVQLIIEDQIKDLEGLTLRASRVDRNLSSSLQSIKDRLESLSGS